MLKSRNWCLIMSISRDTNFRLDKYEFQKYRAVDNDR